MGVVTGDDNNPLTAAAAKAWLKFANGTYSQTDQRIFEAGFMAGHTYHRQQQEKQERYEEEYERLYGSRKDCY